MNPYVEFDVEGLAGLKARVKKYRKAYDDLPANLAMASVTAGQTYLEQLKEEAPERKLPLSNPGQPNPGGLRKGLRVRLEGSGLSLQLVTTSDKFYAGIIKAGNPAHPIAARGQGRLLRFFWAKRGVRFTAKALPIGHPYVAPNPFDERAYHKRSRQMKEQMLTELRGKIFP